MSNNTQAVLYDLHCFILFLNQEKFNEKYRKLQYNKKQ